MSIRISRIRALGACSAICWHSAARSLASFRSKHGSPQKGTPRIHFPKENPAETGEEPAGFVFFAGLGVRPAKLDQ
jgi:hypothetical protein